MRASSPWIVVTSALLSGCLLLTNLDELESGGEPTPDGSADPPQGDATLSPDARAPSADTRADATPDAARLPFCQTTDATFCDDYERDQPLGSWAAVQQQAPSLVRIADAPAGGRELSVFSAGADSGVGSPYAYLEYAPTGNVERLRWAANVSFDEYPVGQRHIAQFVFTTQPTYTAIAVAMNGSASGMVLFTQRRAADGGILTTSFAPAVKLGPGETKRLELEIVQGPPPNDDPRVVLSVDGAISVDTILGTDELLGTMRVRQGVPFGSVPDLDWTIRYDDTTIDVSITPP